MTRMNWDRRPGDQAVHKKDPKPVSSRQIDEALRYLDECKGVLPEIVWNLKRKHKRDPAWRPDQGQARGILNAKYKRK